MPQPIRRSHLDGVINTFIISVTIAAAGTFSYINYLKADQKINELISRDIQLAVQKGIDPIIIRCVYQKQSDNVCIVLAATRNSDKAVQLITDNSPKK